VYQLGAEFDRDIREIAAGPNPPADAIAPFQYERFDSRVFKMIGGGQSRDARADDDCFHAPQAPAL